MFQAPRVHKNLVTLINQAENNQTERTKTNKPKKLANEMDKMLIKRNKKNSKRCQSIQTCEK